MSRLLALLAMTALLPGGLSAAAIKDVSFAALPGDKVQIIVKGDGPLPRPASFNTDNPPRLAIDFNNVSSEVSKQPLPVGIGLVRSVQTLAAGERTRLVVNLSASAPYEVSARGNEAIITVSGGTAEGMAEAGAQQMAKTPSARAQAGSYGIRNIDFRRGPSGEGRLLVSLSNPNVVADMKKQGANIIVNIPDSRLPPKLMRKLDVTDFATPVQFISAQPDGANTQITIEASGIYEHLAYQTDNDYVVELRPLTAREEADMREKSYTGERLSLNFQDIEVRSVLQLLADFTGMNLVVSDSVRGNITLRLQNVPWDHALDIILKSKGLEMRQKDNVMRIGPASEIIAAEKLEMEAQKSVEELAPLQTEWFRINYAKASDIESMIKKASVATQGETEGRTGSNFLSSRGSITVDQRTNTLLVRDTADSLDNIRRMLAELDVPVQQVLIESRIVQANENFAKDLGIRLGMAGTQKNANSEGTQVYMGGGLGRSSFNEAYRAGNAGIPTAGTDGALTAPLIDMLAVNLPAAAPTSAINFVLGRAFSHIISLELTAMQNEGKGEVISSPRVLTSNQNEATISQGVQIPYQEASSSGATTTAFQDAVLELKVTPQITPDDRILMDLSVKNDTPQLVGNAVGVNTQSVKTQVLVENGDTVVLGGVFTQQTNVTKSQTPVLGDLPYLGNLFKQKARDASSSELLVFITPRILKEGLSQVGLRAGPGK